MNSDELVRRLRAATENEVATALEGAKVALPLTTAYEALEFFNFMVDVLTGQRAKYDAADRDRIPQVLAVQADISGCPGLPAFLVSLRKAFCRLLRLRADESIRCRHGSISSWLAAPPNEVPVET